MLKKFSQPTPPTKLLWKSKQLNLNHGVGEHGFHKLQVISSIIIWLGSQSLLTNKACVILIV